MIKTEFKASRVTEALRAAMNQLDDMTPIYADVAEYVVNVTRQRFVTGTGPDGKAWAPKKQTTLDRYKRLGYGNLDRVLIGPGRRLSREIIGQAVRSGAVIGSALIYSRIMQEGAAKGAFGADRHGRPIPWGPIPARAFLGLSAGDETAIVEIVEDHLAAKLDGAD